MGKYNIWSQHVQNNIWSQHVQTYTLIIICVHNRDQRNELALEIGFSRYVVPK